MEVTLDALRTRRDAAAADSEDAQAMRVRMGEPAFSWNMRAMARVLDTRTAYGAACMAVTAVERLAAGPTDTLVGWSETVGPLVAAANIHRASVSEVYIDLLLQVVTEHQLQGIWWHKPGRPSDEPFGYTRIRPGIWGNRARFFTYSRAPWEPANAPAGIVDSTTQSVIRYVEDMRQVADVIAELERAVPLPAPGIAGYQRKD